MARPFEETPSDPIIEESYQRFSIAMGILPEEVTHPLLANGFSRRGIFAPPFTMAEHIGRLEELRIQTMRIAGRRINPREPILNNHPLVRTILTFEVVKDMPMVNSSVVALRKWEAEYYSQEEPAA